MNKFLFGLMIVMTASSMLHAESRDERLRMIDAQYIQCIKNSNHRINTEETRAAREQALIQARNNCHATWSRHSRAYQNSN